MYNYLYYYTIRRGSTIHDDSSFYLAFLASVRKDRPEVLGVGGGPMMLMSAPMVVYGQ